MMLFSDPNFGAMLTFLLIGFFVSLGITLAYKYTTNQRIMKQMRDDIKKYQDQMRKTKDAAKVMEIQKKAMDVNMRYMMQSMRPTLFTLLPVLFIFGLVATHLSFSQLLPNQPFNVTVMLENGNDIPVLIETSAGLQKLSEISGQGSVNYTLMAPAGSHMLTIRHGTESIQKPILVSTRWDYELPMLKKSTGIDGWLLDLVSPERAKLSRDSSFNSVSVHHSPVYPFGDFSIFGYRPGWVMTYIIFSLVFSMLFRKVLNIS